MLSAIFDRIKSYKRRTLLIAIILYFLILNFLINVTIPLLYGTSYSGFLLPNFKWGCFIIAVPYIIILIAYTINKIEADDNSTRIICVLNCVYFIPACVYAYSCSGSVGYILCTIIYWANLIFTSHFLPRLKIKKRLLHHFSYDSFVLIASLACSFIAIGFGIWLGSGLQVFSLENIYTLRLSYREQHVHWLINNVYKTIALIIPVLVSINITRKKYLIIVLLVVGQLSLYTIAANKSFIYTLIFAVLIASLHVNMKSLPICFLGLTLISLMESLMSKTDIFINIVRRVLELPALGGNLYYKYFVEDKNPLYYVSYCWPRITALLNLPDYYSGTPVGMVIGSYYIRDQVNFNTGLVGAGLAKYGLASLIISPISLVIGLRIFSYELMKKMSDRVRISIILTLTIEIISATDFTAALIGLSPTLGLLLFLAIMPENEDELEL